MENSFLPLADAGGLTTSYNGTAGATSTAVPIKGPAVLIQVNSSAAVYVRFGRIGDSVTTSNGIFINKQSYMILSVPSGATHIHHIRQASSDTLISITDGIAGT